MSIPPLFAHLFDDAALFPPGNAAMPAAVGGHAGYRQQWYAGLVSRFVCPAARLAELGQALDDFGWDSSAPPDIAMTVPGGPAALAGALAIAEQLPGLRLGVVELPVGAAELPGVLDELDDISEETVAVCVEVPLVEVTEEVAAALHGAGLGLKLRTGGTTAAAFPSAAVLGAAIEAAVAGGVRFKCTAGLHNAVRHDDPATGFAHHGFLNVLLAIHSALAGGRPPAELLAETDGAALAEQARVLAPDEVAQLRQRFACIGSCSISEPLTDLIELKLVTPA